MAVERSQPHSADIMSIISRPFIHIQRSIIRGSSSPLGPNPHCVSYSACLTSLHANIQHPSVLTLHCISQLSRPPIQPLYASTTHSVSTSPFSTKQHH
jgi:hypothetical protein